MEETWHQIVADALKAGLGNSAVPVPGAKLRELIVKTARARNLEFPPPGHEDEPFKEFLKHFEPTVIVVRSRKGRDLLAAPADRPQLLADATESGETRLREDIFEAFTRIPRSIPPAEPWYAVSDDRVVWLLPTELSGSGELVKIPAATLEQELSERKSFIQTAIIAQEARNQFAASLDTHSALGAFSRLTKAHGLAQAWHRYRFQTVVRRIRGWCAATGISWHEAWVSPEDLSLKAGNETRISHRDVFGRLIEGLNDEDLRRIAIPLDIVLKLLK